MISECLQVESRYFYDFPSDYHADKFENQCTAKKERKKWKGVGGKETRRGRKNNGNMVNKTCVHYHYKSTMLKEIW